jgi:hypothetical protein
MSRSRLSLYHLHLALLLLLVSCLSCGSDWDRNLSALPQQALVMGGGRAKGDLKGYVALGRQLTMSLISDEKVTNTTAVLDRHLPSLIVPSEAALILGGFLTSGNGSTAYVNGTPNAVSIFLWSSILWSLASDLAEVCQHTSPDPYLRPEFVADLRTYCKQPDSASFSTLWLWIVGYVAEGERLEVEALLSGHWKTLAAADALYILLMNPYVLLEV